MGLCNSNQIPPTRQRQSSIHSMNKILEQLYKQQEVLQNMTIHQQQALLKQELREEQFQSQRAATFQNLQQKFNQLRFSLSSNQLSQKRWQSLQQDLALFSTSVSKNRIDQLQKHNQKLLKQITKFKKWRQKSLLKEIFRLTKKGCKQNLAKAWQIWRPEYGESTNSQSMIATDLELSFILDQSNIDTEGIKKARHLFDDDLQFYLQNNHLLNLYHTYNGPLEKPLMRAHVFKFFQEMMDKKYEADQADLQARRPMRTLTEFMWDHLNRVYGLKSLARKALYQIIPTLQDLYNEKHQYGLMICRVLHLFHPEPVLLPLAVFLTKARHDFNKLEAKKRMKVRENKRGKSPIGVCKNAGNDKAFLVDLINMIYNLFQTDKFSRGVAIKLMKPEEISVKDYILFRICHKIVKIASMPQQVFNSFDIQGKEYLSRQDLVYGVRKVLELSVNNSDLQAFLSVFDNTDHISKQEFAAKTNLKIYYQNIKKQEYSVTKGKFLNSLIEAYKIMQIKDTALIRSWVVSEPHSPANFEGFQTLMLKIDPLLTDEQIQYFFQQSKILAFEHSPEDAFCKVTIKFGVGLKGLHDFSKIYSGLKLTGVESPDTGYIEQLTSTSPVKLRKKSFLSINTKSKSWTPAPQTEVASPTFGKL